jgi:hypothetical protein
MASLAAHGAHASVPWYKYPRLPPKLARKHTLLTEVCSGSIALNKQSKFTQRFISQKTFKDLSVALRNLHNTSPPKQNPRNIVPEIFFQK